MYDPFMYADAYTDEIEFFYDVFKPSLKQIYDMFNKKAINKEQYETLIELAEME